MENYYLLFNINMNASSEEIENIIKQEQKKWNSKMNSPKLEKQAEAQNKLVLLDKAKEILLNPAEKEKYDNQLESNNNNNTAQTESQFQPHYSGDTAAKDDDYYTQQLKKILEISQTNIALALKEANDMKMIYPDDSLLWELSGNLNLDFKNYEEAEQDYLKSIRLDPTTVNPYVYLARLCFWYYRNYPEGYKRLDQALSINPDSTMALEAYGQMSYESGQLNEASKYYEKLLELVPDDQSIKEDYNTIQKELDLEVSDIFYNNATNIYRNNYFKSEKDVNAYIEAMEKANEYHSEAPYKNHINNAQSKLRISVDFKYLSMLIIPLILGSFLLQGAGVFGVLIFSTVTSIILFNGICQKWKIEKRRAMPIIDGPLISPGLKILGALNLLFLLSLLLGAPRLASILIILAAAIYYYGYPKWKEKKVLNKVS